MFLNRQRELSYLDARYARSGAEFAVLYGRRRVGKSSLIYEWCQGKPFLYFFAARLPGPNTANRRRSVVAGGRSCRAARGLARRPALLRPIASLVYNPRRSR